MARRSSRGTLRAEIPLASVAVEHFTVSREYLVQVPAEPLHFFQDVGSRRDDVTSDAFGLDEIQQFTRTRPHQFHIRRLLPQ